MNINTSVRKGNCILMMVTSCIFMILLSSCGNGARMVVLASEDAEVHKYFVEEISSLEFRKEVLHRIKSGKTLSDNEGFIEVWHLDKLIGWVYYIITDDVIARTGYQRVGREFIKSDGKKFKLDKINTGGVDTKLWDGKEVK